MSTQRRLLKTSVAMLCLGLLHVSALHAATTNVLQWSFTSTSGPVTVPITDSSGFTPPHPGTDLLHGGEPVYSADIPTNRQHTTGTGSIDFTSVPAAISTTNSLAVGSGQGIITPEQVAAAGGLTMEVWVKNPVAIASPGAALNMGGMYLLGVDAAGKVGFWHGDNSADGSWATAAIPGEWMHLAVIMRTTDPTAASYTDVSSYLNGSLIKSAPLTLPWFLTRATSVGNHQYDNWSDYDGLVYEPRITLGPLGLDQLTIVPPPVTLIITRQPADVDADPGATATFTVTAAVTGASADQIRYQWQRNETDIPGATNATYTTPVLALGNDANFRVNLTVAGTSVTSTSRAAHLRVSGDSQVLLHYGFDFTSGTVQEHGGSVADDGGRGNVGFLLTGDGGTYSPDAPPAAQRQNTKGTGSLDATSGAISTDPLGQTSGARVLGFDDIIAGGGLTMEAWVKGGTGRGVPITIAGAYALRATAEGYQFVNGFDVENDRADAVMDPSDWHHIAGVLSNPSKAGNSLLGDMSLYVDGRLVESYVGAEWILDLARGASVGDHPLAVSLGIDEHFFGLIFDPRVTVAALSPKSFTVIPPQYIITITNQPQNAYALVGGTATFSVGATVEGATPDQLRYQWQRDRVDIPNATGPTYTTPAVAAGETGQFRVVISVAGSGDTLNSGEATLVVYSRQGTALQYGFDYTSGTVTSHDNGSVTDDSGNNYVGGVLSGDGGTYVADRPDTNMLQNTKGIGSLDLTTGSIATDPTGGGIPILSFPDILGNGGLTLEAWVKGGGSAGIILANAGLQALQANETGVEFVGGGLAVTGLVSKAEWHHVAGVLSNPFLGLRNRLVGDLALYVDGVKVSEAINAGFDTDAPVGASIGNHPNYLNGTDVPFTGIVFDPRITLGALAPSNFTIRAALEPPHLTIRREGNEVVVEWTSGALQSAEQLSGEWSPVPGQTNGMYRAPIQGISRYYRAVR